jgi:chemotaxis protein CheX
VIVSLTGEAEGRVIFTMDLFTAKQLAGHMIEETLPEMNSFARSAIAELASIATGKALSEINDAGNFLKMAPPVVISGTNLQTHDHELETLVAPIHTTYGEVRLNVSVQDLR